MKKIILYFLSSILLFAGCETEQVGYDETEVLVLSLDNIQTNSESQEVEVTINSILNYDITSDEGWLWITPSSKTGQRGTNKITFIISQNTTTSARVAKITIGNKSYGIARTISVKQEAGEPYITLSDTNLNFDMDSGAKSVSVDSNVDFTFKSSEEWCKVSLSSNNLYIRVNANVETISREAVVTIENEKYGISEKIQVTQSALAPTLSIGSETLDFAIDGGSKEVVISANFEYQVSCTANWLQIVNSKNGIQVTSNVCMDTESRTADISIVGEKYGISKTVKVVQDGMTEYDFNRVLFYRTSDKNIVTPYNTTDFGASIIANEYNSSTDKGCIIFNTGISNIGDEAFMSCKNLTDITIPKSVISIGERSFQSCGLSTIELDGISSIGGGAFSYCDNLTNITIPNSVVYIGNEVFYHCNNIKAFSGKYADDNGRCLVRNNTIIAYAAASGTTYTIPNNIISIESHTFAYCDNLVSVTIPDSVTSIGDYAFYYCANLISVTIGDGVTSIGALAFYPWSKLKELYCMAIKPPKMTLQDFLGHDAGMFGPVYTGIIYVPRTSVNSYKSAEGWKDYSSSIVGFDF